MKKDMDQGAAADDGAPNGRAGTVRPLAKAKKTTRTIRRSIDESLPSFLLRRERELCQQIDAIKGSLRCAEEEIAAIRKLISAG